MSAAVWCVDLGLKALLIERSSDLGGQLLWTHNPITNYLGNEAPNGVELATKFADQVRGSGVEIITRQVSAVDLSSKVVTIDRQDHSADAIVIATGVRRRKLGVPGEDEFAGRGILASGSRDRELTKDKTVVIVGGGDAALENASILSDHARKVVLIHRRGDFSGRPEFIEKAQDRGNVEFILDSTVTAIEGADRVERVFIRSNTGDHRALACEAVLVRIGVEPNTSLFSGKVGFDDRGYVLVDKEFRTTVDGFWAIGDVTGETAMTIANAVGSGSVAAKNIAARR